jgi:hypothetical protein
MTPWSPPPDLLQKSLPELLKLYAAGKIAKEGLKWARNRIKELWDKREYGFTPDPELASDLQKVSKTDAYSRMKDCIGKHRLLSIIKLGIKVMELSEEGKGDQINRIRNDVYKKYGTEGVRIISMGSTGVLIGVIQYLSDIKIKHNYDQKFLSDTFEKILAEWTKITIFHKKEDGQRVLESKIIKYMDDSYDLFFVFAAGVAGDQAAKGIASLKKKKEIQRRNYMFSLYERKEDKTGRKLFTWVFEKLEGWGNRN